MKPIKQVTLADLALALDEGRRFYEEASTRTLPSELKAFFKRLAAVKDNILKDLREDLAAVGDPLTSRKGAGPLCGNMTTTYATVLPLIEGGDRRWLNSLSATEGQLLALFNRIYVDDRVTPTIGRAVGRWRSEVRACRDALSSLVPSSSAA